MDWDNDNAAQNLLVTGSIFLIELFFFLWALKSVGVL